ncbi:hypothetical protein BH09PSE2_BH09PSE2_23800 [soil metagenome]
MTSMRFNSRALRTGAVAAVSLAALAGLSACEERPYSVPVRQAYAPPKPSPYLAGAPVAPTPPATYAAAPPVYAPAPAPPTYAAPPAYVAPPTYASAPPAYTPPPLQQTYRPAPAYDTGGPMIVAMAPIPNPTYGSRRPPREETGYGYAPRPHHGHAHGYVVAKAEPAYPAAPKPAYHPAKPAPTPAYAAPKAPTYAKAAPKPAYAPKPAKPATYAKAEVPKPAAPMVDHTKTKTTTTTTVAKTTTTPVKTAAADAANSAKLAAAKTAAAAKVAAVAGAAKVTAGAKKVADAAKAPAPAATTGDRTTKLAALQTSLTDAVSKAGVLTLPARFTANQPADVSLTLPATFAETLRKEADKQGLSDAAASVNMTSVLAGDGFSVTPDDTQSQPLTVGQPTEFHWTVTAQPGAKGPLHADVCADLLGGGSDTLSLGSVQKNAGMQLKMTPRMLGAGILALIVILVLGWLARGRNTPTRSASARRAGRQARGSSFARPLDMASDDAPAHH